MQGRTQALRWALTPGGAADRKGCRIVLALGAIGPDRANHWRLVPLYGVRTVIAAVAVCGVDNRDGSCSEEQNRDFRARHLNDVIGKLSFFFIANPATSSIYLLIISVLNFQIFY